MIRGSINAAAWINRDYSSHNCCAHVIINGEVLGPVEASDLLELQPKANIEGDVSYKGLEMHQGALIAGRLSPLLVGAEDKPTLKLAANND